MADAFLDAERLAVAVLDGRELAFQHYWRERDVATLPLHFDAIAQGRVGFNEPFMRWVVARLGMRRELSDRVMLMLDRKIDPDQIMPTRTLVLTLASALAHGRWDVLQGFLQRARGVASNARELTQRKRLLAAARAEFEREGPRAPSPVQRAAEVTLPNSVA
jgi:hypothetical protein